MKSFKKLQNFNIIHEYYKTFVICIAYIYYMTKIKIKNYRQFTFQLYFNEINVLQSNVFFYFNYKNNDNKEELKNNIFI